MESMKAAVSAYQDVQIDAAVLGASPHELIAKLFAKSIESIAEAKRYMLESDIPNKTAHLQIAISIISDGLRGSLDMEAGGEIAEKLDLLYEYMLQRLMTGHAGNDPVLLDEVVTLLLEVKAGWDGIKP